LCPLGSSVRRYCTAVLPYCTDIADQPSLPVIRTSTVSRPPLVQSLRFVWWSALSDREGLKWPSSTSSRLATGYYSVELENSTTESLLVARCSLLVRTPLRHDVDWTGPQPLSRRPLPFLPPSSPLPPPAKIGIGDGLTGSLNQSAR
jgi:hypothetical protein